MFDFPNSPTTGQTVSMPDGSARVWDGTKWQAGTSAGVAAAYLPLSGGTLTGMLTLSADPSTNLQAATKQYVDNKAFLPFIGGSLTGHVYMATTPVIPADAGYAAMLSVRELLDLGHIAWNSYITNVPNWKYRNTGYAAQEWLHTDGSWRLSIYASGTAGNVLGTATGTLQLAQTGQLTCGGKGQFNPAIIATAATNPCVTCWNTGGGVAMGMWCQPSQLNFGNTDGGGTPTAMRASLTQTGNFTATGNVSAVNVTASGTVTATGNIVCNGAMYPGNAAAGSATYLSADANYATVGWAANYGIQFRRSDALTIFLSPAASGSVAMTLDNTGSLTVQNSLTTPSDATAINHIARSNFYLSYNNAPDFVTYTDGNNNYWRWQSGWELYFYRGDGSIVQCHGGSTWFWMQAPGAVVLNNITSFGGVGGYVAISDIRGKTAITHCERGMDIIRDLRPVEFVRQPRKAGLPSPRVEIGFIAQDVQEVLPEAVTSLRVEEAPGQRADALAMSTTPIVAVMVNALKEIEALVRDITARVVSLEAA